MVVARLLVERGAITESSHDWGVYEFVSMPSPGDRIAAEHDAGRHYLTVICVHHQPVRLDAGGQSPTAAVVAKWTSSG